MTRTPHTLSPRDIDTYRQDGYLIVKQVFDPAATAGWTKECKRLWEILPVERSNPRVQWRCLLDGREIADRIDPVLDISPVFTALAQNEQLVGVASSVLDGTASVFKCKLITKRPGTLGYKMHQDYPYWEFLGAPADDYVNVLVAFDSFTAASGATEVFPGLHHERIPPPADSALDADESRIDTSRGKLIELEPGDVALFHSMTPHRSEPNRGERDRRGLFLTYTPSRLAELREHYERGRIDRVR